MSRAHLIMRFLDYTPEQIELAGRDAFNYQGVGNPHTLANVKTGEKVRNNPQLTSNHSRLNPQLTFLALEEVLTH